jgi:hypothetical protein
VVASRINNVSPSLCRLVQRDVVEVYLIDLTTNLSCHPALSKQLNSMRTGTTHSPAGCRNTAQCALRPCVDSGMQCSHLKHVTAGPSELPVTHAHAMSLLYQAHHSSRNSYVGEYTHSNFISSFTDARSHQCIASTKATPAPTLLCRNSNTPQYLPAGFSATPNPAASDLCSFRSAYLRAWR